MGCNEFEIEARRNPYIKPPKEIQDAVKDAMNTPWQLNEDAMKQIKNLGNTEEESKEILQTILGKVSDEDLKKLSKDNRMSAEGRNLDITRSVEALFDLDKEIIARKDDYLPTDVYFDWFVLKSSRMMMDSNGVNIQNDKLHRFMFTTPAQETTIVKGSKKYNDEIAGFKIAIAQAFGFSIDKETTTSSIEFADKIIATKNIRSKVLKHFREGKHKFDLGGMEIKIEHPSHTIAALFEIENFNKHKNDRKFTTRMTLEVDGLTSGFGLKTFQMPLLKDVKKWLVKTGIIVGKRSDLDISEGGMNDVISNGLVDSYKTLASEMGSIKDIANSFKSAIMETYDSKNGSVISRNAENIAKAVGFKQIPDTGITEKDADKAVEVLLAMEKILPEIVVDVKDDNIIVSKVTKEGRNLFKKPFMTFNYGAGWTKIRKELAYGMMGDVVQTLYDHLNGLEVRNAKEEVVDKETLDNIIKLLGLGESALTELDTKSVKDIKVGNTTLQKRLEALLGASYGSRVQEVMKKEFEPIIEANNAVNASLNLVYLVYDKLVTDKIKMMKESGEIKGEYPTKDQELAIFEEYRDAFPIIKSPLSDDLQEGIAIFKTKMEYLKEDKAPATILKGGKIRSTQSVRRFLTEIGSSGAVVPIHALEASIMAKVMKGLLEVNDALVVGVGQVINKSKDYNKELLELNKNWSMLDEVRNTVDRVANKYPYVVNEVIKEEMAMPFNQKLFDIEDVQNIYRIADTAREARAELFNNPIEVHNMVYNDKSGYKYTPPKNRVKSTDLGESKEVPAALIGDITETSEFAINEIIKAIQNKPMKVGIKNGLGKIQKIIEGCK